MATFLGSIFFPLFLDLFWRDSHFGNVVSVSSQTIGSCGKIPLMNQFERSPAGVRFLDLGDEVPSADLIPLTRANPKPEEGTLLQ
jgi:hypothetical protein